MEVRELYVITSLAKKLFVFFEIVLSVSKQNILAVVFVRVLQALTYSH